MVLLIDDLQVVGAREIAEKVFASTPTFVLQQKDLGRFPQPSWRTPGNRGKLVWLVATVEQWMIEYQKRTPPINGAAKRRDIQLFNDAAVTATKIAEKFDASLRKRLFNNNAGRAPGRENEDERASAEMVSD